MESEGGENVECFLVLRKPLLVRFCFVVWVLFGVFSIFSMTSFGVCIRPQCNTKKLLKYSVVLPEKNENYTAIFCHRLGKRKCQTMQRIKEIIWQRFSLFQMLLVIAEAEFGDGKLKVICRYLVLKNIKVDDDIITRRNIYLSCEA